MADFKEVIQVVLNALGVEEADRLRQALGGMGDAGAEANAKLSPLVDQLDTLAATSAKVDQALDLSKRVSENSTALEKARAELAALNAEFDRTDKSSEQISTAFAQAEKQVKSLSDEQFKLQSQSASLNSELRSSGVDVGNLAAAHDKLKQQTSDLSVQLVKTAEAVSTVGKNTGPVSTAIGAVERSFRSAGQSISDFANKTTNIGAGIRAIGTSFQSAGEFVSEFVKKAAEITGIASLIAGLAASFTGFELFKKGAEEAADFDEAISKLSATSGLAGDELSKLGEQAKAVADETTTGAAKTVSALADLTSELGNSGAALDALTPTILLSKAAQLSLADAARDVATTLKAFHDPALTAAEVTDTLSEVSRKTGANLGTMTDALAKLAPTATELGFSFKDTVAAIGLLQTRGLSAEASTRSLMAAFTALADPTSELRGQLVGLGINTASLSGIIDGLAKAGPRGEEAIRSLGARGTNALLSFAQAGVGSLSAFEASLNNVTGATQRTADAVSNNLRAAARDLSDQIGNLAGDLEQGAFEPLTKEVQSLTDRLKGISQSAGFAQIKQAITDFTTGAIAAFEKLIGSIDFKAAGQNIASFVADAGENIKGFVASLGTIGTVASGIGTAISVAFNGVKTVFFTVGAAASATIAVLLKGFAALAQAGGQSAGIVAALNEKADEYFEGAKLFGDKAAESARNVAAGFGKLADAALASGKATVDAKNKIDDHTASSKLNADQTARLRAQYDALPDSVKKLYPPFDEVVKRLQGTGEAAQTAVPKIQQVITTMGFLGTKSGLTGGQVKDLEAAFKNLGVTSQYSLDEAYKNAKKFFETVESSGDGSAAALANTQNAFLALAEKALAATAQLSDGEKLKVQADLESKASTLGVTEALKQLEATSASSAPALVSDAERYAQSLRDMGAAALEAELAHQRAAHNQQQDTTDNIKTTKEQVDANNAAEKSYTEYSDEANAAALATRHITADTSHANDGMQRLTQAIGEARAGFLSISQVAATYYDTVLQGAFKQALANDDAGAGFDRVAKAIQVAADETNKAISNQRAQIAGEIDQINELGTSANKSFGSFGNDAAAAAARMGQLAASIASGKLQIGLLGQADLAPLQQALEAARQRTQALADAAKDAKQQLADINDELQDQIDEQTGNKQGEEDRRYQKQLQQLKDLFAQSGKLGTDEYNQAVAKANQLHALKMQQIKQEQDAQNGSSSGGSSSSASGGKAGGGLGGGGSGGGGGLGGGSTSAKYVVHSFQFPGDIGNVDAHVAQNDSDKFEAGLRLVLQQRSNSIIP